jgi:hypothetical protein
MNEKDERGYAFRLTLERIRFFMRLTPEERLRWLDDAHAFVKNALPVETIRRWKIFVRGGSQREKEET